MSDDFNSQLPASQFFSTVTLEEFRATLEQSNGGLISFDAEWRIVYTNTIAEGIFKLPRDRSIGTNFWELYPDLPGTRLETEYRLAASGEVREFEECRASGDRWYRVRCFPRPAGGMSAWWHDITAGKVGDQASRAVYEIPPELDETIENQVVERTRELAASKELYRSVVEDQTEVISRFLPDGTFIYVNEVYCRVFGKPADELIGSTWQPVSLSEDVDRVESDLQQLSANNPVITIENRVLDCLGDTRWMEFINRGFFDADGRLLEIQSVGRDITRRKLLEKELLLAQASINAVSDGIHWMRADTSIVDVNPAICRMLGYTKDEIVGRSILDFDPHVDKAGFDAIGDKFRSDSSYSFETEHRAKDGTLIPVEVRATSIRANGDELICSITRDIRERKCMENALRASEERYRQLFELAGDAIMLIDIHGNIIKANGRACRQYGYSRETLQTMNVTTLNIPEHQRLTQDRLADVKRDGSVFFEAVHHDAAGNLIYVEVSVVEIVSEGVPYILSICRDVSGRKQQEFKLSHILSFHDSIINNSPLSLFVLDGRGMLVRANRALCHNLRLTESELVGRYNIFEDAQLISQGYLPLIRTVFDEGQTVRFTTAYDTPRYDPTRGAEPVNAILDMTISPVIDSNGVISNVIVQSIDITAAKKLEEELAEALFAADRANKAKSVFLANMSHEIRTPLNAMFLNVQLLQSTALTDEQAGALEAISTCFHDLISLVNDILDLSKIEAGKLTLEQHEFNLKKCLSDVVTTQKPLACAKGLGLTAEFPDDLPELVLGDQLRFRQIIVNFLHNAIKFTQSGMVAVTARCAGSTATKATITVSVTDTGIGIGTEAQARIFEPFSQAEESTSRRYGGSGLGLAICRQIVELMKGKIWLESNEGKGSTFSVSLPFDIVSRETTASRDAGDVFSIPVWDGPPLRILYAEDSIESFLVTVATLQRLGFTVAGVNDGHEVLETLAAGETFDLILMDIQMPVLSGVAATEKIRSIEHEKGGHIPIIALTAHALNDEKQRHLGNGFDGYISKPVSVNELLSEIRRCLRIRGCYEPA